MPFHLTVHQNTMLELIFTKVKLSLAATSNVNVSNFFFLTGEKGSGKTALVERIIDEFRLTLPGKKVTLAQFPATTQGARSLYWILTNGEDPTRSLFDWTHPGWNNLTGTNLLKNDFLIIDNINQVSGLLFDHLHTLAVKARNNNSKVFGGLTVLCVGDMLDIPPADYVRQTVGQPKKIISADYPFKSKVWMGNAPLVFYLKGENFKFQGEELATFRRLRYGDVESLGNDLVFLNLTCKDRLSADNIVDEECYIVPFHSNAKDMNGYRTSQIESSTNRPVKLQSEDKAVADDSFLPSCLYLCVGVQVIFLIDQVLRDFESKNQKRVLKGTLAIITSVSLSRLTVRIYGEDRRSYLVRKISDAVVVEGFTIWSRIQYPLLPAFSVTVRQAQSLSVRGAILDMGYVKDNDDPTTKRLVRGLVYAAVGNLPEFNSLLAIKGVTDQLVICSNKLLQSQEALGFDQQAEENCEFRKGVLADYIKRNPIPAQPVPKAAASVTEAGLGAVMTQALGKMTEMIENQSKLTSLLFQRLESSQGGPQAMPPPPPPQPERAQYNNFAANHWSRGIPAEDGEYTPVEILSSDGSMGTNFEVEYTEERIPASAPRNVFTRE